MAPARAETSIGDRRYNGRRAPTIQLARRFFAWHTTGTDGWRAGNLHSPSASELTVHPLTSTVIRTAGRGSSSSCNVGKFPFNTFFPTGWS